MPDRRAFLATLVAAAALRPGMRYGAIDVKRHRDWQARGIDLRVITATGLDVTHRCRFADDTGSGYAECFLHRHGRPYLDHATNRAAIETIHGIRLVPRGFP